MMGELLNNRRVFQFGKIIIYLMNARETAQGEKASATELDNLSLISKTYMVEGES